MKIRIFKKDYGLEFQDWQGNLFYCRFLEDKNWFNMVVFKNHIFLADIEISKVKKEIEIEKNELSQEDIKAIFNYLKSVRMENNLTLFEEFPYLEQIFKEILKNEMERIEVIVRKDKQTDEPLIILLDVEANIGNLFYTDLGTGSSEMSLEYYHKHTKPANDDDIELAVEFLKKKGYEAVVKHRLPKDFREKIWKVA